MIPRMIGRPGTRVVAAGWPGRMDRALRVGLCVLAMLLATLCVAALSVQTTARRTVLNAGYYQSVLDRQDAYDRLYDQVLVDPQSGPVTRDLLARLPVPQELVLSNLKLVLPPTTLRQLVNEQITAVLRYLRGDGTATLTLKVDLAPVVANLPVLVQDYLGDLVAAAQRSAVPDFPAFMASLKAAVDDVANGRRIGSLPVVRLSAEQRRLAERVLLAIVPSASRSEVRPMVAAALETGDLASALAAVGPYALAGRVGEAYRDLVERAGGRQWDIVRNLEAANAHLGALTTARSVSTALLGPLRLLALVLGVAAMVALWLLTAPLARRLIVIGGTLAAGGALALLVTAVVRWEVRLMIPAPPRGWPPSLRALVADLQHDAAGSLFGIGLVFAAIPLGVGLLIVAGAWLGRRLAARGAVLRLTAPWQVTVIGVVVSATVIGVAVAPSGTAAQHCLGSTQLCSLRYDQAAFLATHNSMATTTSRFLLPLQDPDITSQLDEGARALLIDTYTWERPQQITERLDLSDLPPDLKAQLPDLINKLNPPKSGLWLCHVVCRAGAAPLVPTLEKLRTWLVANPGEIVTLIIQDDITAQQTARAFAEAGLDRLLFTPPADPKARWPTLGDMVRSGRRLVVFAENADGPALWYHNFYRYGMETPFAVTTPKDLTCEPFRGGTDKQLFLLNNFITISGGSRLDAAIVNARKFILDRVNRCQAERHHLVNFVAVDYATIGDTLGAVDALNAERLAGQH